MYTSRFVRCILFTTVFLTGAAVLIVEVAAVRLLSPVFGSSLYVLSSVLSTILFALSIGYFVGGRLADRAPDPKLLYTIIMSSGLVLLLLLQASSALLGDAHSFNSQIAGPLITALLFFFLPAFLLGMDSPYVIKLLTFEGTTDTNGAYVGTTFFWSTVGSIVGSLASGFWLIPTIGVSTTLVYTSLLLVFLGAIAPWLLPSESAEPPATLRKYLTLCLIIIGVSFYLSHLILTDPPNSPEVIHEYDGLYSNIRVEERRQGDRTIRQLRRDTNHSSAVYLGDTEHVYSYTRFVDLHDELVTAPQRMLMIGGGAYTIPRRVVDINDDIIVDVAEIEPSLFRLAQTYFDLTDVSRINNYPMDARVFMSHTTSTYDFIFTDAMSTAHSVPFHLTTTEFFMTAASLLTADGVLMANYIGVLAGDPDGLTNIMYHTLRSAFAHVAVFQTTERDEHAIQNLIFIASQVPLPDTIYAEALPFRDTPYTLADLAVSNDWFTDTAPVLTDDKAPVELLMAKQLQQYRNNR